MIGRMDLVITLGLVFGAAAAAVAFLLTRRDLGGGRARVAAAVAGVAVGLSWFFVLYLAVLAYVAAAVVYVALRRRLRPGRAVLAAAGTYVALAAAAGVAFTIALSTM
jgi:uncharacterized protein YqgC (DUF456 family)